MREQTELTFLIGYDRAASPNAENFERRVIELACKLCGGCAVVPATGYWMSDGAEHKQTFGGRLEQEHTFQIKLTCENEAGTGLRHDAPGASARGLTCSVSTPIGFTFSALRSSGCTSAPRTRRPV